MEITERFRELYLSETLDYPCPYYNDGRTATAELVYPFDSQKNRYHEFLAQGFCRSFDSFFQNLCRECRACLPLRLRVRDFHLSRSQKRAVRLNADVDIKVVRGQDYGEEKAELFCRYKDSRHPPREGENPDEELRSIHEGYPDTVQIEYRTGGRLIAVSVIDEAGDAYSSHSFYYDPVLSAKRSLGVYSAVTEIALTRLSGKTWYYLGFYIRDISNMAYKKRFQPCELYREGRWEPFQPGVD